VVFSNHHQLPKPILGTTPPHEHSPLCLSKMQLVNVSS
jgi:hypothetical protein